MRSRPLGESERAETKRKSRARSAHARPPPLAGPLPSAQGYADVLAAHGDFCRRTLARAWAAADPSGVVEWGERLRESLAFGAVFLEATCRKNHEVRVAFVVYTAHMEEEVLASLDQGNSRCAGARRVWEEGVAAWSHAESLWLGYAAFEHRSRDPEAERRVFRRALQSLGPTKSLEVEAAWILMERVCGDVLTFEAALAKVTASAAERRDAAERREASKAALAKTAQAEVTPVTKAKTRAASHPPKRDEPAKAAPPAVKRPRAADASELPRPKKLQAAEATIVAALKEAAAEGEVAAGERRSVVFVVNLPYDATERDIAALFTLKDESLVVAGVSKLGNKAGRFRGMATVEFATPEEAGRALQCGLAVLGGRELQLSLAQPDVLKKKKAKEGSAEEESERSGQHAAEPKWPVHPTTVFVTGLDGGVTDQSLSALFEHCGPIEVARVLVDKATKRSRCQGLVQFKDAAAMEKAFAASSGMSLSVAPSRFPAALPAAKRKGRKSAPKPKNPYLEPHTRGPSGDEPPEAAASSDSNQPPKPRPQFSFIPRALRK